MESYLQDLLEVIFAATYATTFDNHEHSRRHCRATVRSLGATFRTMIVISSRSPTNSIYALRRNINTVTTPTSEILLHHLCKMLISTESIPVAYSYLIYTLGRSEQQGERASKREREKESTIEGSGEH